MILHSARIENYKGLRGPVDVSFAPDSPNLLEGPNGAGKSTLVEAILCGLTENHNTTGAGADQMRPRETALTPSITVVFEHGGAVYRVSKTFLDSPSSLLERRRPDGSFAAVAKGKQADEQTRDMVRSQGAKAKGSPERMGLLAVLCSPQGKAQLPALTGSALTDIREMLGAQVSGKRGGAFEKVIDKKYLSLWTPGGKPKKGKLTDTRDLLEMARAELQRSQESMGQIRIHEAAAFEERSRAQLALERLRDVKAEYDLVSPIAQQVSDLRARRGPAASRKEAANARYGQLWAEIERIAGARQKARACEEKRPSLEAAATGAAGELNDAIGQASAARENWQESSQADIELQQLIDRIERAAEFLAAEDRLQRARKAAERRNALESGLAALNAPDTDAWAGIQAAGHAFDEARLRVEALELRLEIAAERDLAAEIVQGDPAGSLNIDAGRSVVAHGDGQIKVRLPGIASFTLSGPAGDAGKWRECQEEKRALLARLLAPFDVTAWHNLLGRVQERDALSPGIASANAEYRAVLGGDTEEDLDARRAGILALEPSWAGRPPDLPALKEQAAARKTSRDQLQTAAMAEWQSAEQRRAQAEGAAAAANAARDANETTFAAAQADLAALESDGRTPAQRQEELNARRRECDSAEEALANIDASLAVLPPDAPDRLTALSQQIGDLESELQGSRRKYESEESAAGALLRQGPYTSLAMAEERVEQLKSDEAAELLRLDAIRRLKTAVDQAKARALAGVSEPVEERATEILERIAGRPLARVQLGDGLELAAVRPEGCEKTAPVEQMSAGEQEQIYFATRLALAEVLTDSERQLLVLDDPLVNTDAERLPRVLEIMQEKSGRFQFVILSCHPERYRQLPGVVARRMEELEPQPPSKAMGVGA